MIHSCTLFAARQGLSMQDPSRLLPPQKKKTPASRLQLQACGLHYASDCSVRRQPPEELASLLGQLPTATSKGHGRVDWLRTQCGASSSSRGRSVPPYRVRAPDMHRRLGTRDSPVPSSPREAAAAQPSQGTVVVTRALAKAQRAGQARIGRLNKQCVTAETAPNGEMVRSGLCTGCATLSDSKEHGVQGLATSPGEWQCISSRDTREPAGETTRPRRSVCARVPEKKDVSPECRHQAVMGGLVRRTPLISNGARRRSLRTV